MADIVISIVAKVAQYLVKPAIRQVQHAFCVNKFIEDLENDKKELTSERDILQDRVEQAKKDTEVIEKPVEKWLTDVKNLLEEVEDLEQNMKANNSCFRGWLPTWRRYRLCKQMVKKTKAMANVKGKSNIQPFSHPASLPGIHYNSSGNFTYFESTILAYNQLLEALEDDSIYMIGLYGMGGCGKTTLVTEVGRKAEELNLFDRVITVTVSQTPSIRSIQGQMADMLNLRLGEESEKGRAQRLWLRLKEEKRILIIADDLWQRINLEDIGICLDNNYKGRWKVLLTTRRQEICNLLDCQKRIQLGLLSEEEAWTLFQKHANINDAFSSRSLNDVPRELCKKCKGLPIAIVAVGSSLKGKSNAEWEVALNSLRHSETTDDQVDEGVRDAFSCLKLSYDYLKNKDAELLFLMCAMFPEDYEIFIENLIRYGRGLGVGGRLSFDLARSRIRAGVNKLVDSCLLMHSGRSKHHVKMHDMVRDVALWIALRSDDHKILVNLDKPLSTLAEEDDIKDYFALSLWCKKTDQNFHQLDAPNLEILLLNTWSSLDLSHAAFEGIEGLKVMAVIQKYFRGKLLSLPQSTQGLTNLRTLRLNGWNLGDMSFIASLTRVEILDLQGCSFNELPNEMEKLKRLKLLDLSHCKIGENYNFEAIGKCSQLEELYGFGDKNLDYHSQSLVDIVTLPMLKRFVIQIGLFISYEYTESMRILDLPKFNISTLGASKMNLLQTAEKVRLVDLRGGCKSIIPDVVGTVGGMNELSIFCLQRCLEIECLIDTTSDDVGSIQVDALIPRFVKLELAEMRNLKELCRGPPVEVLGFFETLEELYIRGCQQLHRIFPMECNLRNLKILRIGNYGNAKYFREYIVATTAKVLFSVSVAQSLLQLEELTIERCEKLKHIITSGVEDGSTTSKEIVPAPRNFHLVMPNLKKLSIADCPELEFIFPISCVEGLVQLKKIEVRRASKLKYVFGRYKHEGHSSLENNVQIRLSLLHVFRLDDLENILGICPENYHLSYPSLRQLTLKNCPKFNASYIVEMEGLEQGQPPLNRIVAVDEDQQKHMTSNLKQLKLEGLPELINIWSSPTPSQKLSLQYLQHLRVFSCNKLKSIFPMIIHKSLSELTSLGIYDCEELEEIIAENEELEHLSNAELCFPKLRVLIVHNCNKLKSLFSVGMVRMLPQLSTLDILEATQLEEVFRHGNEGGAGTEMEIVLPNLTQILLNKLPSFVDVVDIF